MLDDSQTIHPHIPSIFIKPYHSYPKPLLVHFFSRMSSLIVVTCIVGLSRGDLVVVSVPERPIIFTVIHGLVRARNWAAPRLAFGITVKHLVLRLDLQTRMHHVPISRHPKAPTRYFHFMDGRGAWIGILDPPICSAAFYAFVGIFVKIGEVIPELLVGGLDILSRFESCELRSKLSNKVCMELVLVRLV